MGRLARSTRVVPNLVPMIDIVSMLVLFFMLATQFISADVDPDVRLPVLVDSQAAVDKGPNKMFVNIRASKDDATLGNIEKITARGETVFEVGGKVKPSPAEDAEVAAEQAQAEAAQRGKKLPELPEWAGAMRRALKEYDRECEEHLKPKVRVVVIRGDKRLHWENILRVMDCISKYNEAKIRKAQKDAEAKGQPFEEAEVNKVVRLEMRLCGPAAGAVK